MPQELNYLKESPSQTAGPYVHIGLAPGAAGFDIYKQELGWDIAGPNAKGERIRVEGVVIDGMGSPVKDVLAGSLAGQFRRCLRASGRRPSGRGRLSAAGAG